MQAGDVETSRIGASPACTQDKHSVLISLCLHAESLERKSPADGGASGSTGEIPRLQFGDMDRVSSPQQVRADAR